MTSGRLLSFLGITVWGAVALTAAPHAFSHRSAPDVSHGPGISYSEDAPVARCSDLHVRFDDHDTVVQTEERTITRSEASVLVVQAESNGGIQVQGWDQDTYSVTLCKAAEAGSGADSTLSKIHLIFQNGELGVAGPSSHDRWSAHLMLRAPKGAALDLRVNNGPLSLHHVDGNLKVHAENGPVTVKDCTGELDLNSHNGPVTLEGNNGKQSVHTENGPVTLSLDGDSWTGAGVEAHATNGPVTLRIPSGYKSGVVIESDGHGPFRCKASVCSEGRKTWDDDRKRIEFGSGPTLIRISTVNGPLSVS
jgi:hypothetical protein